MPDILTLLKIDIHLSYLLYPSYIIETQISISDERYSRVVVDSSHGGLLVTDGSIHPVVSVYIREIEELDLPVNSYNYKVPLVVE